MRTDEIWETPPSRPVLAPDAVHVWRASLRLSPTAMAASRATLSADEGARAARFHVPDRRELFIAARGIQRAIISRYLGIPPAEIAFRYSTHGKPELDSLPESSGIRFNASNSGSLALYALTRQGEVGIDVERLRAVPDSLAISKRFFSAPENAHLERLPSALRELTFFRYWTRREAYVKAVGVGLSMPLDRVDVTFAPDERATVQRTRDDPEDAGRWMVRPLSPGKGCVGALAVRAEGWRLVLYEWREAECLGAA